MESIFLNTFVEVAKALGALATPVVVVVVAYLFQRKQKLAEAAMTERIKRIALISPLLNQIFSYRHRVGGYLDWSPEEILQAKRDADREFRTYEFLWTPEYREAYHRFMEECFATNRGAGNKAGIRADERHYPKKASTPNWEAFTGEEADKGRNQEAYNQVQSITARDLGFRR
jgi:hypothetical protein